MPKKGSSKRLFKVRKKSSPALAAKPKAKTVASVPVKSTPAPLTSPAVPAQLVPAPSVAQSAPAESVTPIAQTAPAVPPTTPPVVQPAAPVTAPVSAQTTTLPSSQETDSPKLSNEVPLEKRNNQIYLVGIILSVVILTVTGVILFLKITKPPTAPQVVTPKVEESQNSVDLKITVMPTPTPDLSTLTLEILNGSGVSGAASKVADQMKALGYVVTKIGNTQVSSQSAVLVNNKINVPTEKLLTDLKELNISTVSGNFEDSTASARIILGKK